MVLGLPPSVKGSLSPTGLQDDEEQLLRRFAGEIPGFAFCSQLQREDLDRTVLMGEFPALFTASLGVPKCAPE